MVAFPSHAPIKFGDVAAMAEFARPFITPWYSGYIYIFRTSDNVKTGSIDGGKNSYTITISPYWHGPARIQPKRLNLPTKETTNDTTSHLFEFQLEYAKDGTLPLTSPGDQIIVYNGGNNQLLTQYQYVITGDVDASDALNNTIWAFSNLEARPNYQFSTALFPSETLYPGPNVFPSD